MDLFILDTASLCATLENSQEITNITSMIFDAIKIGVPLILIFVGMFDFGRAVMAGKEDEIKGHQKLFIKRLISALLVFLVLSIVEFFVGLVAPDSGIMECIRVIVGANK